MSDRTCVNRMAQGDAAALAELYDSHGAAVYTLALRIVRHASDAEEVVQEVFAQAWRQAPRYDAARATVPGWLMMMTRARALDAWRAKQARPDVRHAVAVVPDVPALGPGQEALILTQEAIAQVRQALRDLSEPLRIPLELAYYEGLSQSEIATRLGQPLGTVKTRMRTALAQLRAALWAEEPR